MSWKAGLTKTQKRQMRDTLAEAHQRMLERALSGLEAEFTRWRAGELNCFELQDALQTFDRGVARELWSMYTRETNPMFGVMYALTQGAMTIDEVPEEIRGQFDWVQSRLLEDAE